MAAKMTSGVSAARASAPMPVLSSMYSVLTQVAPPSVERKTPRASLWVWKKFPSAPTRTRFGSRG